MTRSRTIAAALALLVLGALYWHFICRSAGVSEPWDADAYWRAWYPLSLALSVVAGTALRRRGWLAGAALTFAQLPVMALNAGLGDFWIAGLLILCILAVPAMIVSALAGWLAARKRPVA